MVHVLLHVQRRQSLVVAHSWGNPRIDYDRTSDYELLSYSMDCSCSHEQCGLLGQGNSVRLSTLLLALNMNIIFYVSNNNTHNVARATIQGILSQKSGIQKRRLKSTEPCKSSALTSMLAWHHWLFLFLKRQLSLESSRVATFLFEA